MSGVCVCVCVYWLFIYVCMCIGLEVSKGYCGELIIV